MISLSNYCQMPLYVCCHLSRLLTAYLALGDSKRQSSHEKGFRELDTVTDMPVLCAVSDVDL